ncbi:MAG: adenylate/guanylate cyclase domain-containing protein [Chloroflexota bacterium]
MSCSTCGTENKPGRAFCVECGTRLASVCPSCGSPFEPGEKFCGTCGGAVGPGTGPATVAGATTAPGGSASGTVEHGPAPVAERRLVSILFADLVGYTTLAEGRDAEDARELLSRFAETARTVIGRYGGTVEKFIGDAVMAVWGTPVAREDDAERAVRAALDLIPAVAALTPGLQARAGILTGETAVNIGATGEGMVVGDVVNTAARLQAAAATGTVLVGEATMHAASSAIAFEPAGEQVLKGKAAPVAAWRALRVIAQRGGQGRSDLPEPPFVGRDEEFRSLKDLIETTGRDRRTRLATISGPGGIGKSRLAWELEKYIDGILENIYWHRGRSPSYGDGITFWALGEMVRRRAKLVEDDDDVTTRQRIAETVAEYVADEADRRFIEPALLTLLGLEPAPAGGRDALFAAWRLFFERIAEKGTTVLLFEDLQWADSGLLDFIDHVVEWSRGVPLLVVTLTRPELFDRRADWGTQTRNSTSLALDPLPPAAMRELLTGFVPGLPDSAVEAIVDRADGMPLYAVETVRALLADGRLERIDGAYRPVGDLDQIAVPDTLRSLIASRLDGLDAMDRSLVQDASVLGHSFSPAGLAAIAGGSGDDLEARLRGLVRREMFELEMDPRSPERGQYRFVQSLIREVAYGTLARRDRRARHLAAARHFESLGDEELAGALATHYLAAHGASEAGAEADAVAIQARLALTAAAERSASLGAHEQSLQQLEQALAVTRDATDRVGLLIRAARSANAAGRPERGIRHAQEAARSARASGDLLAAGQAESVLGVLHIDSGQIREAVAVLETARDTLPEDEQGEPRAELLTTLSRAYMRNDQMKEAYATADAALALSERLELDGLTAEALQNKAGALGSQGRRHESIALMQAAVDLARSGGFLLAEMRATSNIASVVSNEDAPRAHAASSAALALARRTGHRPFVSWALTFVTWYVYLEGRQWDEMVQELELELEDVRSPVEEARILGSLVSLGSPRGQPVRELLDRRATLIADMTDPFLHAIQHWNEAKELLLAGNLSQAADLFEKAGIPGMIYPLGLAARAALWAGDIERLTGLVDRLERDPEVPTDARALGLAARAGLDGLEGRRSEALAGYRDVFRRGREGAVDFEYALFVLDAVVALGPDEPELHQPVEDARSILERVGAQPYLAKLDEVLASGPAGNARTTDRAADHRAESTSAEAH